MQFLSGIFNFFPLPYTRSFFSLTATSTVKSFSSCQIVYFFFLDHTDVTFKSFSKGARATFSSVSSRLTHLWCFQVLELFKAFSVVMTNWLQFVRQFFLVLNDCGAALPVSKPTLLSTPCFIW